MADHNNPKIIWDASQQLVMANQMYMVVVDQQQIKAPVTDEVIPWDSNIGMEESERPGLKEKFEETWRVKTTVAALLLASVEALTPKLGE